MLCLLRCSLAVLSVVWLPATLCAQPESADEAPELRREVTDCPALEDLGYRLKAITDIQLDISLQVDRLPEDCSKDLFTPATGMETVSLTEVEFAWAPSELYSQPAYFDDPVLERYGQTRHPLIQPWLSGAHFFGTFPLMPYKMGIDRTHDRIYTLGYYRPGSPMPCLGRRLPWEADAAGFEAATWLALIFIFP